MVSAIVSCGGKIRFCRVGKRGDRAKSRYGKDELSGFPSSSKVREKDLMRMRMRMKQMVFGLSAISYRIQDRLSQQKDEGSKGV